MMIDLFMGIFDIVVVNMMDNFVVG